MRQFLALPINVVMSFCTIRSSKNEGLGKKYEPFRISVEFVESIQQQREGKRGLG